MPPLMPRLGWSAIAGIALLTLPASAQPSGTWLDDEAAWNSPGAPVPAVPDAIGGNNLENCDRSQRPAALPEDDQVTAAGWTLFGAAQVFGSTTLISAMADADGMCRPLQYQVFVFSDGVFVGTLSPVPMDSRTDGSLIDANLYREDLIVARFNRYAPMDALCCASGQSRLSYTVEVQDGAVVVPSLPADTFEP